jgi:hypothetical protein
MLLRVTRMVPSRRVRVSRCAERPISTPRLDFGQRGVRKGRFAHGGWIWASAVCRSVDLHTGQEFRASAVCRSADLHTGEREPSLWWWHMNE